jgi:hypothetical protein
LPSGISRARSTGLATTIASQSTEVVDPKPSARASISSISRCVGRSPFVRGRPVFDQQNALALLLIPLICRLAQLKPWLLRPRLAGEFVKFCATLSVPPSAPVYSPGTERQTNLRAVGQQFGLSSLPQKNHH